MKTITYFKIYKSVVVAFVIVSAAIFNSYATTTNCPVTDDSFITEANQPGNYGSYSTLTIGKDPNGDRHVAMLKFDLSSIPSGATINSAYVVLTKYVGLTSNSVTGVVCQYLDNWSEGTITWNNAGSVSCSQNPSFTISPSASFWNLPATNTVIDWIENGQPNRGVFVLPIAASPDGNSWFFYSKESSGTAPYLYVDYTTCTVSVPSGSTVSPSSGSTNISVTSNGVSNWTANESCSWVTLSPTSGTGNGTVTATYSANTSCSSRSCTISFSCGSSSDSYTLTQNGVIPSCTIYVTTGSTVSASSGSANITVTSNYTCGTSWTANESCSWVSISPTSGTGSGNVTVTYQANTGGSRSCTISFSCGSSIKV